MKIKTKKQLNLPQLIEWAWGNPKRHEIRGFINNTRDSDSEIYVQEDNGFISVQGEFNKDDTFTVEVEEELTEDTVIPRLTCYTAFGFKNTKYNISINDVKSHDPLAFYIMNDDLTMTLIWRNGKLVE